MPMVIRITVAGTLITLIMMLEMETAIWLSLPKKYCNTVGPMKGTPGTVAVRAVMADSARFSFNTYRKNRTRMK